MKTGRAEKIVMMDEPGLTELVAVYVWHGAGGVRYSDERTARYSLCTHRPCHECGKPTPRDYLLCNGCRDLQDNKRWEAMPRKPWDGVAILYSQRRDEYFQSIEDAEDTLEEDETLDDLQLIICEPNRARRIDLDYFCDELGEDDNEGPPELQEACDAFNAIIDKAPPLSWSPGKFALAPPGALGHE